MARKDRTGNRKTRDQRAVHRIPEDTKKKLVIKVIETKTQNLIQKCLK